MLCTREVVIFNMVPYGNWCVMWQLSVYNHSQGGDSY